MVTLSLSLNVFMLPEQFKYCVAFEILGGILTLLVLVLSVVNIGGTFNLGPRIFVANMMVFNLIHTVCTMVVDVSFIDPDVRSILGRLYITISNHSFLVQSWALLVFNATLVPMMAVSLVVTHRPDLLDGRTSLTFAVLILVADGIPTAFQAVNVWRSGIYLNTAVPYMCASYTLYVTQMCLTVVALYCLFRKSSSNVQSSTGGSRKIVYRFLLFSIGPCLIQLPFALQQITRVVRDGSELFMAIDQQLYWPVKFVFALKPAVDALSTLLFLGEYRQYSLGLLRCLKKNTPLFQHSITKVTPIQSPRTPQTTLSPALSPSPRTTRFTFDSVPVQSQSSLHPLSVH